ncbi:MAG: hypothetical protein LC800_17680, partial [Acidobacteria bacterium]|nr:hypothetical protein [Acidobacteriota bacterium]
MRAQQRARLAFRLALLSSLALVSSLAAASRWGFAQQKIDQPAARPQKPTGDTAAKPDAAPLLAPST